MDTQINNICRLCLEYGQLQSIFNDNETVQFSDMIRACLYLHVSKGDGLPETICETCISQLFSSYKFKRRCEISDEKLRGQLLALKESPIMENIKSELVENYLKEENTIYSSLKIISNKLKCDQCNRRFKTENSLKIHYHSHNEIKESAEIEIPDANFSAYSNANENLNVLLQNVDDVDMSHIPNIETGTQNKTCEISKPDKSKFLFQCEQCGRIFKQKSVLLQHLQSHSGIKPFVCKLCDTKFTRSAHLAAHSRIHMKIRPFICETCGRGFTKSSDLCRHKRIHSDEKNYSCTMCEKKFKRSADVISHMRSHTGQKPYNCKMCSKSYSSHSALTKHTKSVSHGIKLKVSNIKAETNSNNTKC